MQKIVAMLLAVLMLCSCSLALAATTVEGPVMPEKDWPTESWGPYPFATVRTTTRTAVVEVATVEAGLEMTEASQAMETAMAAAEHPVDVYSEETVAAIAKVIGGKEAVSLTVAEINGITLKNVGTEDVVLNFVFLTEFSKDQTVVAVVSIDGEETVLKPVVEADGSLTITFPTKLAKAIEATKNAVLVILVG